MSLLCPDWFVSYAHRNYLFDQYILPYTIAWRIRRRTFRFLKSLQVRGFSSLADKEVPDAGKISSVLLIYFTGGLGDALYMNGLIHYLVTSGLKVSVVAPKNVHKIFRTTLSERAIYDLFDSSTRESLYSREWDVVVDLSYFVFPRYDVRVEILTHVKTPVIGIDPQIRANPFACSEYLDISSCKHIGERWARVANRITGRSVCCLPPFVGIPARKTAERYIYVNTIGSALHRTLTQKQINWIADFFNKHKIKAYFYCAPDCTVRSTDYVSPVRPCSFADACSWIGAASGVVSPDTSIVHVATAYGVPQLAIFARNSYSGFGVTMLEEFHPLTSSINLIPRKKNVFSKEIVPISAIGKDELDEALQALMTLIEKNAVPLPQ